MEGLQATCVVHRQRLSVEVCVSCQAVVGCKFAYAAQHGAGGTLLEDVCVQGVVLVPLVQAGVRLSSNLLSAWLAALLPETPWFTCRWLCLLALNAQTPPKSPHLSISLKAMPFS